MKEDKKKKELLQVLNDVDNNAQSLKSKGIKIVERGQYISDLCHHNKEFIELIPNDSHLLPERWENQVFTWQNVNKQLIDINSKHDLVLTDSSSLSATVSSGYMISTEIISNLPQDIQVSAMPIFYKYEQFIEQSPLFQKINYEISRIGLPTDSTNKESAVSLLKQAGQAFKSPSVEGVSPSAVLIPLREAINCILSDLLPKRPKQEIAKGNKEKVRSICRQCSFEGIDSKQIEILANEVHVLNALLSGAKQNKFTRDHVRELLNRGLVFLLSLLQMIDNQKIRI